MINLSEMLKGYPDPKKLEDAKTKDDYTFLGIFCDYVRNNYPTVQINWAWVTRTPPPADAAHVLAAVNLNLTEAQAKEFCYEISSLIEDDDDFDNARVVLHTALNLAKGEPAKAMFSKMPPKSVVVEEKPSGEKPPQVQDTAAKIASVPVVRKPRANKEKPAPVPHSSSVEQAVPSSGNSARASAGKKRTGGVVRHGRVSNKDSSGAAPPPSNTPVLEVPEKKAAPEVKQNKEPESEPCIEDRTGSQRLVSPGGRSKRARPGDGEGPNVFSLVWPFHE